MRKEKGRKREGGKGAFSITHLFLYFLFVQAAAEPDARARAAALRRLDPTINLATDSVDRLAPE